MKKITFYFAAAGMAVSLCACEKIPQAAEEETTLRVSVEETQTEQKTQDEQQTKPFIQSVTQPNERTTHHETDVEKDRLLAFLHNELSLRGYPYAEPGTSLYYGDIEEVPAEEKKGIPCYQIMDVTGNGTNEYVFYLEDTAVCMAYNEADEQFSCLWTSDTNDAFFLGDGQILIFAPGKPNCYTYLVINEDGDVTERREFSITLDDKPLILIDGKEVTEDTWKEEFDWIMDLYHTRVKPMTLENLSK